MIWLIIFFTTKPAKGWEVAAAHIALEVKLKISQKLR